MKTRNGLDKQSKPAVHNIAFIDTPKLWLGSFILSGYWLSSNPLYKWSTEDHQVEPFPSRTLHVPLSGVPARRANSQTFPGTARNSGLTVTIKQKSTTS